MPITYTDGSWVNARGQTLQTVLYLPAETPVATLVWHHGFGEHIGRYTTMFTALAEEGIAVVAFDAHGHGKSDPKSVRDRAVIWKFSHLVDDLYGVLNSWKTTAPPAQTAAPMFIGGQSMGGLVAATAVLRSQEIWAGMILHSAALDVEWTMILRAQAPVSGLLAKLIPYARIVPAVRPEDMSPDAEVVQEYLEDPLNTVGNVPVRSASQMLTAFKALTPFTSAFTLPILAVHGKMDKCTSLPAVGRFVTGASSGDKTLIEVEGGYHELLHGAELAKSTTRIVQWVQQRSKGRSSL